MKSAAQTQGTRVGPELHTLGTAGLTAGAEHVKSAASPSRSWYLVDDGFGETYEAFTLGEAVSLAANLHKESGEVLVAEFFDWQQCLLPEERPL